MSWGKSAVRSFVERARLQKRIEAERAKAVAEASAKNAEERLMKYRFICVIVVLPLGFILFLLYAFVCSSKKNELHSRRYD